MPPRTPEEMREVVARMAEDLRRLQAGWRPGPAELVDAPKLDGWMFGVDDGGYLYLVGLVTGHPSWPGEERVVTTSPLVAAGRSWTWARTVSRFYVLGEPAPIGQELRRHVATFPEVPQ